ncbi:MAG: biliverdin-producing heme oxygenase [Bacteroidota bacterium]
MFSDTLKDATQQNHQDLEKIIVPKIRSIRSEPDYVNLLNLFYSYFGGLEARVQSAVDERLLPDYSERRKAMSILNDIEALDGTAIEMAANADLPEIKDHTAALGALYVMEGSTLGGKIISKMIAQALPGKADHALTFYQSYGENTGEMWNTFKTALNEQVNSAEDQQSVIDAANDTFLKFSQWIEKAS